MNQKIKTYGWIPDLPDHRDHLYAAPMQVVAKLPAKVDLRPQCPPVYDQGQLGSCTANSIGGAFEFTLRKEQKADFMPSRLFIYYNERVIEGTVKSDSGAQIRDGIKSIANQGVCAESEWPYIITKFTTKPPAKAYKDALKNQALSYSRVVQSLNQFKGCLAAGSPFVFGITVHAILAVGYDDSTQRFIIRNSWGPGWGQKGYFTLPYAYLLDSGLSSDFWTIRIVE